MLLCCFALWVSSLCCLGEDHNVEQDNEKGAEEVLEI